MSLQLININGEDRYLLLAYPEWNKGVSITHYLKTEIEEGLTGIEARRPEHDSLRLEMDFSCIILDQDAATFRDQIKEIKDKRVMIPLWPDLLDTSDWDKRIYDTPFFLGLDYETLSYALNPIDSFPSFSEGPIEETSIESEFWPQKVPIISGYFKDDPEIELLGMQQLLVKFKFIEDSPFTEEAQILPISTSDNWPSILVPDWLSNRDSIQNRIEHKKVGVTRQQHIEGSEGLTRLLQQAKFHLSDRTHINTLLSFYKNRSGRTESFILSHFIQGETNIIQHGRYRFAKNGIKINYTAPGVAEASISFTEAPDFVGEDQNRQSKAYLYEFVYDVPTPVTYRYTSYEKDISYSGNNYESQKIEHSNRKQSTNPAKDEITIACGEFTDSLGRRNPFWRRVGHGLERQLNLTIYECDPHNPDSSGEVYWHGSCGEINPEGRLFKAKCIPFSGRLTSLVPGTILKHSCNNFFCDGLCDPDGSMRAALLHTGTVIEITSNTIELDSINAPSGFFAGGWLEVGNGDEHEFRAILYNTRNGNQQTIVLQRPLRHSHENENATLMSDCNGMPSRCKAYGNYHRFRGFPFIPWDNPSLPDVNVNVDYSKK